MSEIKQLQELLGPHLEDGSSIVDYKINNLTKPGENYGSSIMAVDVIVQNLDGQVEIFNLVAKKIPENQFLQEAFQVQYTVDKEIYFYSKIIPTLKKFQTEQDVKHVIDFFPKFFGGRKNLNPLSDEVDEDGVLLLENLKCRGYVTIDRNQGFNLEMALFILKDLAVFHAVPLALKNKKPEVYKENIEPYTNHLKLFEDDVEYCKERLLNKYDMVTGGDEECAKVYERVKKAVYVGIEKSGEADEGKFCTIIHNDYWVNNTMLLIEDNKPIKNKIVDFQIIEYGSLGRDLLFFLFSSVQTPVVRENYDTLIRLYYEKFTQTLDELKCDISEFNFEDFENELAKVAKEREFLHLMYMLKPIFASPHEVKDIKEFSKEDLTIDYVSQRHKDKCCFIIKEFSNRKWI